MPSILLSEIQKKRCLLFLGAGFSLNADVQSGKMPNMKELGKLLSTDIKENSDNPLEIASIYEKELGRPNLIKKLNESLHVHDATPGDVHKKLAEMSAFDTIVTTNFEFLLERSFHAQNKHVNVIVGDKNIGMYDPSTDTNIIKIHGDLRQTDEIVITKEDYANFHSNHQVLAINLAAWFSTKVPLFIGYSLCDPHFLEIRKLLKNLLEKFLNPWFIVKFDATKDEIEEARKDSLIIVNLETDGRTKKDTLLEFFSQIQEYINAKNVEALFSSSSYKVKKINTDFSDDQIAGKIINYLSELETKLRDILRKSGQNKKELRRSLSYLARYAFDSGVLSTSDIKEISRICEIRSKIIHEQYHPTLSELHYVEEFTQKIIKKLTENKVEFTSQIQIALSTNKKSFQDNDTLVINGSVTDMISNVPVVLSITGPNNNIVSISQLEVKKDKTFDFIINVGSTLWEQSGKYAITAKYGMKLNQTSVSIQYNKTNSIELSNKIELKLDSGLFSIPYLVQGGKLESLFVTIETNVLTAIIDTFTDGKFWIKIPRKVLDARTNGNDDNFFVICDGVEIDFIEKSNEIERELIIPFQKGTEEIIIVGTIIIDKKTTKQDINFVEILEGSSTPRDDEKYLHPQTLIIKKGQNVKWVNKDTASHTITSGTPEDGPNGIFDSSLIKAGIEFEYKFEKKGTYRYHCLVHPWKEGKIIVVD